MDKESLKLNNTIKFKKNKTKDEKLRQLDNKLAHINKKIDTISQRTFLLNRRKKDIEEKKIYYKTANKNHNLDKRLIKEIKILSIKINNFILYVYFKFLNNKKNNINKKISELIIYKTNY